jgi:catalase
MTLEEADNWRFNSFDVTKVWPHSEFPLIEVGRLVLNRNPRNYFAEVEQMAYCPSHMVPGVEPSPDKMLQARLWSYVDTHRHRLGPNYQLLPVNRAINAPPRHYQRDGPSVMDANQGGAPNYFPNSFNGPQPDLSKGWYEPPVSSGRVARYDDGNDHNFEQVGDFYRTVLCEGAKRRLVENIAGNMAGAQEFIRRRAIANFSCADKDLGSSIARKVDEILREQERGEETPSHLQRAPNALNPPRKVPSVLKGTTPSSSRL